MLREEPPEPRWRRFARQFADPLVILLLAAAAIAAVVWLLEGVLGLPIDSIVILAIVLLNATLGYVQEARAERAIAALRALTEVTATAVRDGRVAHGPRPRARARRPARAGGRRRDRRRRPRRHAASRSAPGREPSPGESEPVAKSIDAVASDAALGDRSDMVFSGTVVTYRARALRS